MGYRLAAGEGVFRIPPHLISCVEKVTGVITASVTLYLVLGGVPTTFYTLSHSVTT